MAQGDRFDLFVTDLFLLYNRLAEKAASNRRHVIVSSRRALAVLRAYPPEDDGEAILIETAMEPFDELLRQAGGG